MTLLLRRNTHPTGLEYQWTTATCPYDMYSTDNSHYCAQSFRGYLVKFIRLHACSDMHVLDHFQLDFARRKSELDLFHYNVRGLQLPDQECNDDQQVRCECCLCQFLI